jgi:excinuclease ABC subunit B
VILYADKVTDSMQRAIDETSRRRALQEAYNKEHGITPETIKKAIFAGIEAEAFAHVEANAKIGRTDETVYITEEYIAELEAEMFAAAEAMEFERAASIRDRIGQMREQIGKPMGEVREEESQSRKSQTGRGGRRGGKKKAGDPAEWKGRVPRPKRNV